MTPLSQSFDDLGLSPALVEAVAALGYERPTPIQIKCIPAVLSGRDVLGQAQTGTGKTGAFALPLLEKIDLGFRSPQVLVMTPTRELCLQVSESFKGYAKKMRGFSIAAVYGGQSMVAQLKQLDRGVHVVVGTPGRMIDHLRRGSLDLSNVHAVVLDEADEMLKMDFKEDIDEILRATPKRKQVALFSATMPRAIREVAATHMRDAEEISIRSKTTTAETIKQLYCVVPSAHKIEALSRILEVQDINAALIFVQTRATTVELAEELERRGYPTAALSSALTQSLREATLERLRNGRLKFVVATDVAARGLDLDNLSHIINYEIPNNPESYVHRIGRTGRAGKTGVAILLVSPREQRFIRAIERATGQPLEELRVPGMKEVVACRVERFKDKVRAVLHSKTDISPYNKVIYQFALEDGLPPEEIAAALAMLVQREAPFVVADDPLAAMRREEGQNRRERREREQASPSKERRSSERRPSDHRSPERRSSRDAVEEGMERYRVEVGRIHGATPGDLVGAITGATGMSGRDIGRIGLFDEYCTVDLPAGFPSSLLHRLQKVQVARHQLRISPLAGGEPRRAEEHRRDSKARGGKPQGKGDRKPKRHRKDR